MTIKGIGANILKNGKATDIHDVPNKCFKASADIISSSLADIFNFSIGSKVFP